MTSICKVCDLPVKPSNMQLHMNKQHQNLSSTNINAAESTNRTDTDMYVPNRWVECNFCHTESGMYRHFLGVRGLRIHESKQHNQFTPPLNDSPSLPPLSPQLTVRANTPAVCAVWPRSAPLLSAQHAARHANALAHRTTSSPITSAPGPPHSPTALTTSTNFAPS